MILRNSRYLFLQEELIKSKKNIIIFGAGMIGQVIIPHIVEQYDLCDFMDCFVDTDEHKYSQKIHIAEKEYEIKPLDHLRSIGSNHVILITNSNFSSVVRLLDHIPGLDDVECYIIPLMQINELKHAALMTVERYTKEQLIPKKIHYCWFGGKKIPLFLRNCIDSWKEKCPDYEIIQWNEHNYDVGRHPFTKEAHESKKYGFVADVARLDILYEYGGIYLDADVMLIKNLDDLLYQPGFIGTEKWGNVNTGGGCGFIAKHPMLKKMLEYRNQVHFTRADGSLNLTTNGIYETKPFLEMGFKPDNTLQTIGNVTIYPSYINHPYDYMSCETYETDSTVSIHYFYGSWMEDEAKRNQKNTQCQYEAVMERINRGGKPR